MTISWLRPNYIFKLVSRVTTQRLPYVDGEEAAALKSVFQLFGETRDIFKAHPKNNMADAIVWHVLNTHVRPFTAKWHRQNERGALSALDATDIFRNELGRLHKYLIRFDALLVAIRDDAALRPSLTTGEAKRESSVAEEMGKELKWGIHEKLGGLPQKTVVAINDKEREAVLTRRGYYSNRLTPSLSTSQPGNTEQRTATDRGQVQQPQPGENPRPHAKLTAQSSQAAGPVTRGRAGDLRRRYPLGNLRRHTKNALKQQAPKTHLGISCPPMTRRTLG